MISHYHGIDFDREKKRIFVADSSKGFYIEACDENGNKLYAINKKSEKIQITKAFKKKCLEEFKISLAGFPNAWEWVSKRNFTYYKYFPPIRFLKVSDGRLFVITFKMKDNKTECVILDYKGNMIKTSYLPFKFKEYEFADTKQKQFQIKNGKFYVLVEDEDTETWELHVHKIE